MPYERVEQVKTALDITSITIAVGTLVDTLPKIAALLTVVWTALRIYESPTVQSLIERWKRRRDDAA